MSTFSGNKFNNNEPGGFHKNPFLYFGTISLILFGMLFFGSYSLAQLDANGVVTLGSVSDDSIDGDLYVTQNSARVIETPDFKTSENAFVYGVATPNVITPQTLGVIMGGAAAMQDQNRNEIVEYTVQIGDTAASVAAQFNLSVNTVLWANDLTKNSVLKTGQTLEILPVDGILYEVQSADTIQAIAKKYKAQAQDIIAFNELSGEGDIFIGDVLVVPGGVVSVKAPVSVSPSTSANIKVFLPDSFFISPLLKFRITQGPHRTNAVDLSSPDGCGASVYASAKGVVQRAVGNGKWNLGMGNYITILHANGISTYYGHLSAIFVKPGDEVSQGDRIGLEGKTGAATGCHVHFQVMGGAANPFAKLPVGYSQ